MTSDVRDRAETNGNGGEQQLPRTSTQSRRAFLVLERRRQALLADQRRPQSLLADERRPWDLRELVPVGLRARGSVISLYENRCLATLVSYVVEQRLTESHPFAGDDARWGGGDQPDYAVAEWAEPWGGWNLLMEIRVDLNGLADDRRKLGRWLGRRTRAKAERRARERFDMLMVDLWHDERRAASVARFGPFAGGKHADREVIPADLHAFVAPQSYPRGVDEAGRPTLGKRAAIIAAVALALTAAVAIFAGAVAGDDEQPAGPLPVAAFAGPIERGSSLAAERREARIEAARVERAQARRAAERRAAAAEAKAAEAEEAEAKAAAAEAKAAQSAPDPNPTETTTSEVPADETVTTPAPEPAAAPAPAPPPAPAAPAPAPAPSGGGGSDCFTFEC